MYGLITMEAASISAGLCYAGTQLAASARGMQPMWHACNKPLFLYSVKSDRTRLCDLVSTILFDVVSQAACGTESTRDARLCTADSRSLSEMLRTVCSCHTGVISYWA